MLYFGGMDTPPAKKPTQVERHKALRQQARAGDPAAQAQVDALNARNRAAVVRAKAAGRNYWAPEIAAVRRAKKRAAVILTPEQVEQARQRQEDRERRAAAKRRREADAAAAPPKPVLSVEAQAAQATANSRAANRASYRTAKERRAAGDPAAIARHEQRLARQRQRNAVNATRLPPEERSEIARQGALKRWSKRVALSG